MGKAQKVHEQIKQWHLDGFVGGVPIEGEQPIEDVIKTLQNLKRECKRAGYDKVMVDISAGYESLQVEISGDRSESEEEKERRLRNAERRKQRRQETKEKKRDRERRLYERLKTKYEPRTDMTNYDLPRELR